MCLDEAQTLETGVNVREMSHKIVATHRWGVTGTPISKNVSGNYYFLQTKLNFFSRYSPHALLFFLDLYPLIDYLQLSPYSELDTWKYLLYEPYVRGNYEPMYKFLSQVMWRSAKNNVVDQVFLQCFCVIFFITRIFQIDIPQQTVQEYFIEFSAVEKHYYKCEHEMCCSDFLAKLKDFDCDLALAALNKSNLKKVRRNETRNYCCNFFMIVIWGTFLAFLKL